VTVVGVVPDKLIVRFGIIALLALLLAVPLMLVDGVIEERGSRFQQVIEEVGAEWGSAQSIIGPVLIVPVTSGPETQRHVVLPATLAGTAVLEPEVLKRSVFESTVYTAHVGMRGQFAPLALSLDSASGQQIDWRNAVLVVGVNAPVGIRTAALRIGGTTIAGPNPGTTLVQALPHGMRWRMPTATSASAPIDFELDLVVKGSGTFTVAPVGGETTFDIRSAWPHPSFFGASPVSRRIGEDGFSAEWAISSLARSYAQSFVAGADPQPFGELAIGVKLMQPINLYSLLDRATKYAPLFIALTFLTLVTFELATDARAHYVQYGAIGLAVALFYLLLLALAEHIGFTPAYFAASSVIVLMVTTYTIAVLETIWRGLTLGALQAATYTVLYVTLTLEDFALLTGTVALTAALAIFMYVTRSLTVPLRLATSPGS